MATKNNRKDWSLIVWVFGWLLSFATTLKKLAAKNSIPFEAFERLVSDAGVATFERALQVINDDYHASLPKSTEVPQGGHPFRGGTTSVGAALPSNHYIVRVDRGPLPQMEVLEREFSKGGVSNLFNGRYAWKRDRSRLGTNGLTDETVEVLVKEFTDEEVAAMGGKLVSDAIIKWGIEHGWLPADEKECHAVGIDPQTRELQLKNPLIALGSSTVNGDNRYVSRLNSDSDRRIFDNNWFDNEWNRNYRFLFVRNSFYVSRKAPFSWGFSFEIAFSILRSFVRPHSAEERSS